jgi:hypothetical protein
MTTTTSLQYTHDFSGVTPAIHVELTGDSIEDILNSLVEITRGLDDSSPWSAKTKLSDIAKPVTKADVKKDPSLAGAHARDEALKILTKTYSVPSTRAETKGLLQKYGVDKFGDIPMEKSAELLEDAQAISKKLG